MTAVAFKPSGWNSASMTTLRFEHVSAPRPALVHAAALLVLLVLLVLLMTPGAHADEGMWLPNEFPSSLVKERQGHAPDAAWLERTRLGAARLANGCSASFVSADGLVMTNHHCIRSCLEELSTPERDLLANPFVAPVRAEELRCDKLELNQLVAITDVTARVQAATQGASGADFQAKLKATQAALEAECSQGDAARRCDLVTLFSGARHHLYAYRRFRDVRLVMAPEFQMAAFGGDPDNFQFPRTGLDVAFMRVWEGDAPAQTPFHLRFAKTPAKQSDLVYVVGHPGGTERQSTVAELVYQRDVALPWSLLRLAELRGRLAQWMDGGPDRTRKAASRLRTVENGLKALRGRLEALGTVGFFEAREAAEADLIAKAPAHTRAGFVAVADAMRDARGLVVDYRMKELLEPFQSELFGMARMVVRMRAEREKPDAERLPELTSSQLPFAEKQLLSGAPIQLDLEQATLTWSLARMQNLLGASHPFVRSVLGRESPEALAQRLVQGTRLSDVAFRKAALEAPELPADPMLDLAHRLDGDARAARKAWEDRVDAVLKKNAELLAEARRAVFGTAGYPDATFTLRVSYGRIAPAEGDASAVTTLGDLFEKATGAPPFALAPSWARAEGRLSKTLSKKTPLNVATTNDIIGGNSGSPLLDKSGDVVGLVFDGNLPSLGGRYFYEPRTNRAVAVHASAIRAALEHVYGAAHLLRELDGTPPSPPRR